MEKIILNKMLSRFVCVTGLMIVSFCAYAQRPPANTYSIAGWWGPPAPPFSPVVHPDHSITFRVKARAAHAVNLLFGEWGIKPQGLTRDTAGVWSITIPPVAPDVYSYLFTIDGVAVPDMNNPVIKTGTQLYQSVVEVTGGDWPRFDEVQHVAHGSLVSHQFQSASLRRTRKYVVYLPPQYFAEPKRRFPVLVLRHGGGDDETSWTQAAGKADVILDNLIARKKAVPMIIVMPNGLVDGTWASGSTPEGMQLLEQEMLKEILPAVEQTYRTLPGRENHAITGLSMGGGQAFVMGLRNLKRFAWVGEFSAGLLSDKDLKMDALLPGIITSSNLNPQLRLFWIGCGTADPRYPGHLVLADQLRKKGVKFEFHDDPGGHEWKVWRLQLEGFLQKVFQQ